MPSAFGDVSGDERRRFGQVLDQHYAWVDERLGAVLAGLGPDDVVVVVSGFGMEPVSLGKRMLARLLGETRLSGSHEGAPDGFMLASADRLRADDSRVGSVLDVTPTLLYLAGLPRRRATWTAAPAPTSSRRRSRPSIRSPSFRPTVVEDAAGPVACP